MLYRISQFLDEAKQLSTSLNRFNTKSYRPVSKDQHITISREVKDKVTQCYTWIRERCKGNGKRDKSYYTCKAATIKRAIVSVQQLRSECTKNKFHQKRCERTCNAALKYLINDYTNSMKHTK